MLLNVDHLHKSFGHFHALRGVSFGVREGEVVSVLGPSGCGKSTLLQLVAGMQAPDQGEIQIGGDVVATAKRQVAPEKRGINMVFQDYALWPHMTVLDNIRYGLKRRKLAADLQKRRVQALLEMLRLPGLEHRLPPQLSGGQQQRVAIARALATEPKLLLMDEPLSNLDMRLRIDMRTEMGYLFRRLGITVLHVTHDPGEAFALADRLLIMRAGQIDQFDTPQNCYSQPATRWAASLLGATNEWQGRVVETGGEMLIEIGGRTLAVCMPSQSRPPQLGERVTVMVRPEDISAASAESAELQTVENGRKANRLQVKVAHAAFEGNTYRLLGTMPDGQQLTWLSASKLDVGTEVWLHFPADSTFAYAEFDEHSL